MRLPGFDYSRSAVYFITFCTAHREPFLAEVIGDQLQLTAAGEIASDALPHVLGRYTHVRLLEYVVMPDHVHALLGLDLTAMRQKSVSRLVGAVKTHAAVRINRLGRAPGSRVWQRGFHDSIIRSPENVARVRQYIVNNPRLWLERLAMQLPADEGSGGRSRTAPARLRR